jgi:hypothetical protein
MPLLDHFHEPLYPGRCWRSFLANWATRLADALTLLVPAEFHVEQACHGGPRVGIDVTTYEKTAAAAYSIPAVFPDTFEVHVFSTIAGPALCAAIELVSPGNKYRLDERRAFATKCASYLHRGISLIIMDIVTNRRANLHNETMRLMTMDSRFELPDEPRLYAVAYRPVCREERSEIDVWTATFAVGDPLPTMPLRLTGDLFVPVDFEATYQEACRKRKLA